MTKSEIVSAIEAKIKNIGYSAWRIGLTLDPKERKEYWNETEKQSVTLWSHWEADSLSVAQDVEAHFINKGMKGGTGGDLSAYKTVYVYVF